MRTRSPFSQAFLLCIKELPCSGPCLASLSKGRTSAQAQRLLAEAKAGVSGARSGPAANGGAAEPAAQTDGPDPRLRAPERQYAPVR